MKKFNLNDEILVQITEYGMQQLLEQNGSEFVDTCINSRKEVIDGETWWRLQAHAIPDYFGKMIWATNPHPIKSNILIP